MAGTDESQDGALDIDPSLLDPASGLFAQPFFLAALSWRVIACRRVLRPIAFAQLEVVDGLPDGPAVPSDPKVVTAMIRATLRNSDVAAPGRRHLRADARGHPGGWRGLGGRAAASGARRARAGGCSVPGSPATPARPSRPRTSSSPPQAAFASAREWPQDRIEVAPPEDAERIRSRRQLGVWRPTPARAAPRAGPGQPDVTGRGAEAGEQALHRHAVHLHDGAARARSAGRPRCRPCRRSGPRRPRPARTRRAPRLVCARAQNSPIRASISSRARDAPVERRGGRRGRRTR